MKRKNHAATFFAVPGFIAVLNISVLKIIKVVTFNMNPIFTKVTLNSFVSGMDIFCTCSTRKFEITGTTIIYQASFCLLRTHAVE